VKIRNVKKHLRRAELTLRLRFETMREQGYGRDAKNAEKQGIRDRPVVKDVARD